MLPPLGAWVQSLVRKLRSCMQPGVAKKKKKKKTNGPEIEHTDFGVWKLMISLIGEQFRY